MPNLEIARNKMDMMANLLWTNSSYLQSIINNPNEALEAMDILDDDNLPLYAWNPTPSAITACATCIFKGPDAGKHTHSDCPPRPAPSPAPSPSPSPAPKK